jgi:magnesium-transporting ATPase (P-type)
MGFKNFMLLEGAMIITAIIFMCVFRVTGIYKLFKCWKCKAFMIPVVVIAIAILTSVLGSIILDVFNITKYEYIIRGALLGLSISYVPFVVPESNKNKVDS